MSEIPPIAIDPHIVPWSYRGSYLCLATRSGEGGRLTPANNDVCLVSHIYPAGLPLFALRPLVPGHEAGEPHGFHKDPSPVAFEATPSCLTWTHAGNTIAEATFQDVRTIRMRGNLPCMFDTEGSLEVDAWRNWLFQVPPTSSESPPVVEFTSRPDSALLFTALQGKFDLTNEAPSQNNNRRIAISPSEGQSTWELEIHERERELTGPSESESEVGAQIKEISFDSARVNMGRTFNTYLKDLCPWQKDWSSPTGRTEQLAAYVMWTSTVRPAGYFKKEAILMSKLWMNKVWSWDNCFNCLALATAYPDIAINQMLLPFDWITPEGRLPDSLCHSEILYDFTKPPIYGWTMYKLLDNLSANSGTSRDPFDALSDDRLTDIYSKVRSNTMFWYTARKAASVRIPWYSHGNDSGWDNATCYDRQTMTASPDLAAFLIVQNDFLRDLAQHLRLLKEVDEWTSKRDDMIESLMELWDTENETFTFQDVFDQSKWTTFTLLKYIPLVASRHLPERIVNSMAKGLKSHLTEWGLATEVPNTAKYESDGYWRGPIWAPPTIIIESGLRQAGHVELANTISERYQKLCDRSGFAENYDAISGAGNRDLSYTWSASTYLVLRKEQAERE